MNNFFCKKEICPAETPYLILETNECVEKCNASDFLNLKCIENNPNINLMDDSIKSLRNAIINHNLDLLLENITIENGKDLLVEEPQIKYQITSSSNQNNKEYNSISTIKLGKCEKELKLFYNISEDESLLIFKIDKYYDGVLTPYTFYELYHPITKEKLDLIHCDNIQINIILPVQFIINDSELYKYDLNNKFYNDICYTYTNENGVDLTLKDRQNEFIDKNLSLCKKGCDYKNYDSQKVECECKIEENFSLLSEINSNKEKIKNIFLNVQNMINIKIIICYKELFKKEGLIKNIGSYIILSIIIIYIIFYYLFYLKERGIIFDKIKEILKLKRKIAKVNKKKGWKLKI